MKVAHLTSVHQRYDTRILLKECRSLAINGHAVTLVVADGQGDSVEKNVNIIDVGKSSGRWQRILRAPRKVYAKALALDADIYHLHDPELLPIGTKLKKQGKKVVFDAHEDFPKQLLSKPYLATWLKKPLALLAGWYEKRACRKFDAIVTATPFIRDKFLQFHPFVIDINNYPVLGELTTVERKPKQREKICFVGGYSKIRGIKQVIDALEQCGGIVRIDLVGNCSDQSYRKELETSSGWKYVNEFGFLERTGVAMVMEESLAGLVTFLPVANHINAQPNKMFEYMSAGIPVIASDFPLWKEIIEGNSCGLCVDPLDPKSIAKAISYLHQNPDIAIQMGLNGQTAVAEKYNWQQEETKLLDLYQQLQ